MPFSSDISCSLVHALFNICYHRCSVFCLSTSVDLIPVCSIVRFSPRCSLPSFPVMPTGLLFSTIATKSFLLLWRHCLHHLACNFVLSRCSSGIRAEFGTALRIDNPEDAWFCQARGPAIQNVAQRGYLPGFAHLGIHVLLPAYGWSNHHCFQPSTWCGGTVLFLCLFLPCTRLHPRDLLLDLSSPLGLATAPFTLSAYRCHREIFATLEVGTCEVSRAWIFSFLRLPWSPRHPHISAVFMSVVWLPCCLGRFMLSMTVPRRPTRNFLFKGTMCYETFM